MDDEAGILRGCRAGQEASWAELYRRQAPTIARFLRRMLGPDPAVDDLVQQVFLEAYRSLPGFRGGSRLSSWLYGIASHAAGKHWRSEHRWLRRRLALQQLDEGGAAPDVASQVADRTVLEALGMALEELDVAHRSVWVMREVEGLSSDEVAAALGIPVGTVRSRLHHARQRVLERLEQGNGCRRAGARGSGPGDARSA